MSKKKLVDLETRQSIHFTMTKESKIDFRIACFRKRLSMQDILEEFAQLVALENPQALKIVDNLADRKRNDEISRFTDSDANSIFNAIETIRKTE